MIMIAGLFTGCRRDPLYCAGAPHNDCTFIDSSIPDVAIDSTNSIDSIDAFEPECTATKKCTGALGACNLTSMTCVQCTVADPTACVGTTPTCGIDNACHACTAHSQCASSACLPDGSCGDDTNVAYVDPAGTDNPTCTKASPCIVVAKALATNRAFVKFNGTTDEAVTIDGGRTVTFLSEAGAKLTRTKGNGAILTVKDNGTALSIFGLSISDAPNSSSGIGCVIPAASGEPTLSLTGTTVSNNPGGGISASGGTLTITRSILSGNAGGGVSASGGTLTIAQSTLSGNAGGGVSVTAAGKFIIVGNVFFNNGSSTSGTGGVGILTSQTLTNRLEFNSFNKNQSQDGVGSAIQCVAGAFTAKNNILSGNGTLTNVAQAGGACSHTYSIVRPGPLPVGAGNKADDPLFKNTTTGDLHLQTGSPAAGSADPNSDLSGIAAHDIDGDPRTAPADLGADEIAN